MPSSDEGLVSHRTHKSIPLSPPSSLPNDPNIALLEKLSYYKKRAHRYKDRLKASKALIEDLKKKKNEFYDELQVLKGVISVYHEQKRNPNLSRPSVSDEEEFADDFETYENGRPQPSEPHDLIQRDLASLSHTKEQEIKLMGNDPEEDHPMNPLLLRSHMSKSQLLPVLNRGSVLSAAIVSSREDTSRAMPSPSGKPRIQSIESRSTSQSSDGRVFGSTCINPSHPNVSAQVREKGNLDRIWEKTIRPVDSSHSKKDNSNKPSSSMRPKVLPVHCGVESPSSRKYHTARGILDALSKKDHFELGQMVSYSDQNQPEEKTFQSSAQLPPLSQTNKYTSKIMPFYSATLNKFMPSSMTTDSQTIESKYRLSDSTIPIIIEPKIFDDDTVRDILCGLGITSSRQFDDSLLVPNDYSYSYQFKVNRTPQKLLKFKDFAPKVFNQIRQHWNVTNADLLISFSYDNITAVRGEGKSGAFFIFTNDRQFILKTATGPERDFLWEILPFYFLYIRKNPNTCLPRLYGVYSMKHEGIGGVIRFIIMNNWFNNFEPIETYDLKGSTVGRTTIGAKPGGILKDLDVKRNFYLDDELRKLLLHQIERDCQFLAEQNVMDYSLLVGIYYEQELDPQEKQEAVKIPQVVNPFKTIFQSHDGGISGWNSNKKRKEIYYCGIIDILQRYTGKKKLEHFLKSIPYNSENISIVEPAYYAKRFTKFIASVTKSSTYVPNGKGEGEEDDLENQKKLGDNRGHDAGPKANMVQPLAEYADHLDTHVLRSASNDRDNLSKRKDLAKGKDRDVTFQHGGYQDGTDRSFVHHLDDSFLNRDDEDNIDVSPLSQDGNPLSIQPLPDLWQDWILEKFKTWANHRIQYLQNMDSAVVESSSFTT